MNFCHQCLQIAMMNKSSFITLQTLYAHMMSVRLSLMYLQLYVHRSGRTARAKREGLSIMLIGPEDVRSYRTICRTLNKGKL